MGNVDLLTQNTQNINELQGTAIFQGLENPNPSFDLQNQQVVQTDLQNYQSIDLNAAFAACLQYQQYQNQQNPQNIQNTAALNHSQSVNQLQQALASYSNSKTPVQNQNQQQVFNQFQALAAKQQQMANLLQAGKQFY